MAILIDPAQWPAHGTTFAHLVSDESLSELHAFARAAGLSARAFDQDHYDVPAERHAELIARGAELVSPKELISRLRTSGLRVPARDRPEALRRHLRQRWQTLMRRLPAEPATGQVQLAHPDTAATPHPGVAGAPNASTDGARHTLGEDLLDRWCQPHRTYHDLRHLRDVLAALDQLRYPDPVPPAVDLAAWFHDAVYDGEAGQDEARSAELAATHLPEAGIGQQITDETARLVLLTAGHDPADDDHHGQLLCDADLAVLGREQAGYRRYVADVRAEYAHVPEPDFTRGRTAVVRRLLALEPIYGTTRAQDLWEERARANLNAELDRLRTGR